MTTDRQIDVLLTLTDPAADREPVDLDGARELFHQRLVARELRSPWPGRAAVIAAAAAVVTALPFAVSAVLPDRSGLEPAAVAADGQLDCGRGFAAPIGPATASLRLLPTALPPGWSLAQVLARDSTAQGWCVPPSLSVLREDSSGTVTGTVSVVGPIRAYVDATGYGSSTTATVDGHPARLWVYPHPGGAVAQRWLWTDGDGQQWEATVDGLATEDAQALLGAVSTSGTALRWDVAATPGWTVVHQRTGAPYDTSRHHLEWTVRFQADGVERSLDVDHRYDDAIPVATQASVGSRLTTVDDHPAVVLPLAGGADADGSHVVPVVPVAVELASGTIATGGARGDLAQVQALLASLTDTPADDPRLAELAGR